MRKKKVRIAIDGPVAAGKSSVAEKVAERLGLLYVDTGAMYRAVALAAKDKGLSWEDEAEMGKLAEQVDIKLESPKGKKRDGRKVTVYLDGKDVSRRIREAEMGEGASVVSQYLGVRKVLVRQQQGISKGREVVMEGRDIGTWVLPEAEVKIYMDATPATRVERKQKQLRDFGEKFSAADVRKDVMTRDTREMTRKVDPLRPAPGAWMLDTTDLSIDEVVEKIAERVESERQKS